MGNLGRYTTPFLASSLAQVPSLWLFDSVYTYAWFVGFLSAGAMYLGGMQVQGAKAR